jgi:hypothetical protein
MGKRAQCGGTVLLLHPQFQPPDFGAKHFLIEQLESEQIQP